MNAVENANANVQTMRDQGIADACNGYPAFAWLQDGAVHVSGRDGLPEEVPNGFGWWPTREARTRFEEAFAYARAYEANQ